MPKEQQRCSYASSSKNAKNKSNRATLLATRDARDKDVSGGTSLRCSSEKDSGYSDGQQTDVEDQEKSQRRGGERAEPAQTRRNEGLRRWNPGKPSPTPEGRELPAVYIINNMVIQQPDVIQNRDQPPQRSVAMEDGGSDAAHVILAPAARQLHGLFPSSIITGRKMNGTYRAALTSYPPTAPLASKTAPDATQSNDESQNLSEGVYTKREVEDTPVTRSPLERHLCEASPDRPSSSSPTTGPLSQSPSVLKTRGPHRTASARTRQFRLHNAAEVLRRSGLLDITLRTKELLRQSNATARDLAELRRHTELLCRAVSDPGATPEQLHRAMAESGSYPRIQILRGFQIPDSSDSGVPRTRPLEARPAEEEEDGFALPDSSTG
ncbi:CLOCK-interacting pacemaker isoform X2 [Pungitius pungitius]